MGKCTIRIYDESTGELLQKQCSKCGKVKDVSEFGKRKNVPDGLKSNCKSCRKESREANPDKYKEKNRKYRQTPEGKAAQARKNHKRRLKVKEAGGTWILEEWNQCLEYFNNCDAYTGQPMNVVTMDHIVALNKGGANNISNIVPANKSTNSSKGSKDLWEWYSKQPYFTWNRYIKICLWIIKNM